MPLPVFDETHRISMPGRTASRFFSSGPVEFHSIGQIGFGDQGNVGAVNYRGIFERLIFAFGDR